VSAPSLTIHRTMSAYLQNGAAIKGLLPLYAVMLMSAPSSFTKHFTAATCPSWAATHKVTKPSKGAELFDETPHDLYIF
jgi:hypothetical protein